MNPVFLFSQSVIRPNFHGFGRESSAPWFVSVFGCRAQIVR